MHFYLTIVSATLFGLTLCAKDFAVLKKDSKHVLVKAKGNSGFLFYSFSIQNGIPRLEIRGNDKDDEKTAESKVQLALDNVAEAESDDKINLAGTQEFWSDIGVEEKTGESSDKQMILRSNMVHTDKDIAGNYFTLQIVAVIGEESDSFKIRPIIQNFPFKPTSKGKGILSISQSLEGSEKVELSSSGNDKINVGTFGHLHIDIESGIEDGNPGSIRGLRLGKAEKTKSPRGTIEAKSEHSNEVMIDFASVRPKNATFVEQLTFNPHAVKAVVPVKEPPTKVKSQNVNSASKLAGLSVSAGLIYLAAMVMV